MAIPVEMPKMSDTMEEGVVVSWTANEGDSVSAGDVIAEVETDKATMDLEVYDDGVLLKRIVQEGEAVPIGGLIAVLGKEGEDISDLLSKYEGGSSTNGEADAGKAGDEQDAGDEAEKADAAPAADAGADASAQDASGDGRVKSSPLARRIAAENDLDLSSIKGSGPEGRIIKRDVEAALESAEPAQKAPEKAPERAPARRAPAAAQPEGGYESVRISQMRKTIAKRLAESKFTSPHFYLTAEIDMDKAVSFRTELNETAAKNDLAKVSYNDLVTKACALALRKHRWVNASWMQEEGEIRLHDDVHVAVAVAVDEGLITPVIRHADRKGLAQIAAETRELAEKARSKEIQPEEYSGSTFSTSNLGMYGIEEFTAIINPPNVCILAIGAIREQPVVKNGGVVPGKRMKVTLSCDHRVVDGATGSEFLATVRGYLEDPLTMLL